LEKIVPDSFQLSEEVSRALWLNQPVVALESTVVTHGLPYPQNIQLAEDMETEVRRQGSVPATIAIVRGKVVIGATRQQLEILAQDPQVHKISSRDVAPAIAKGWNGGTTVAGTLFAAEIAGLQVFATGGIGGVHREAPFDISADLLVLARSALVVVCAGAKAILDLPATLEYLETVGVPVVGYCTDEFPAFYSPDSGLPVSARADTPDEIVEIARKHWEIGQTSAVLVVNPPPQEVAVPAARVAAEIEQALQEAAAQQIRGQAVTPFLLQRVTELTGGASLRANLGLLRSNARLASQIARSLMEPGDRRIA
jgi:pseudouridine-5'-phosphate glycosidase